MRLKIALTIKFGKDEAENGDNGTDPGDVTTYPVSVGFITERDGRIEEVL